MQLKGATVAKSIMQQVTEDVQKLKAKGITPCLAIIRVGESPDDIAYERAAIRRCENAGINVQQFVLSADCTQEDVLAAIHTVNTCNKIHGCLLLRPLPSQIDEAYVCNSLYSCKDVDGITHESMYGVFANELIGFPPCTAAAVIAMLNYYDVAVEGANVCVIGRSAVIGKPVSMMLQAKNATVTMCHSRTQNLKQHIQNADIVVVAIGKAHAITADMFKENQVVIDVGINWDEQSQTLVGDVDTQNAEAVVRAISPVPGGVGSVTTAILAQHVVAAAQRYD